MDRLAAMTLVVTAAEAESLSAGGRTLGVPLSTVSRNVAELEAHLGAQLLTRSSRQLTLTDVGRSYVAACKRLLDDLREAEEAANRFQTRRLRAFCDFATPRVRAVLRA